MKYLLLLHVVAVVVWVGGMFFAYMALRPAAAEFLEAPERLQLWTATLRRFFSWVWVAVGLLLLSGFGMIYLFGGFAAVRWHVHVMLALAVIMMLLFAHVFFAPFARLRRDVAARDWKSAAGALNQIRLVVATNLVLGLLTIVVALLGRAG